MGKAKGITAAEEDIKALVWSESKALIVKSVQIPRPLPPSLQLMDRGKGVKRHLLFSSLTQGDSIWRATRCQTLPRQVRRTISHRAVRSTSRERKYEVMQQWCGRLSTCPQTSSQPCITSLRGAELEEVSQRRVTGTNTQHHVHGVLHLVACIKDTKHNKTPSMLNLRQITYWCLL